MRNVLLIFSLFLITPAAALTQSVQEKQDVVYLKNGSIIRGVIIESDRDDYIRIRFSDSNVMDIHVYTILEIKEETVNKTPGTKREGRSSVYHYNTSGYMNRSGVEILTGSGANTPRFYTVNGIHFNPHVSAGFGLGLTPYNEPLTLIPFFVDFNYRFLKANTSPYLSLKAGYNFSIYEDEEEIPLNMHSGGLIFNPGLGIEFNLSSGFGWYIQAGYNIDQSTYEFDTWGPQTVRNDLSFRRVSMGMGLTF